MQSLVNYHKEKYLIYEAKFKNLNADELAECDRLLKSIIDNDYELLTKSWSNRIAKEPTYGEKYFVEFKNPFADTRRFSATSGYEDSAKPVESEKTIKCIGIADKFGRIFLQNLWNTEDPAYIEYKKAERKKTKDGKSYLTKEGWYLTRKDIECYRVKKWYSGKRGESPFYFVDEKKSKGAWGISLADEIRFVKSLSSIPAEVKKISDDIAKKTEEENRIKEKEAERKKFWDARKDYKCMGCANGWKETPPEVLKAYADKDAKWFTVNIGRCYNEYWCDTYKLYYSVDSSD